MGGYGSGNHGGRPTADMSLRIDLAWMLRTGRVREGATSRGTLSWSFGDEPAGSISYEVAMDCPGDERLVLTYTRGTGDDRENVRQVVRLCYTVPHYGGKRWWMICPYRGIRVGKLYKPVGGDRFASRQAWRLAYNSQRRAPHDRASEALFRLQRRLGCEQGWERGLRRPKGMWHRTFERHWQRYDSLDRAVGMEMMALLTRLQRGR